MVNAVLPAGSVPATVIVRAPVADPPSFLSVNVSVGLSAVKVCASGVIVIVKLNDQWWYIRCES